MVPARSLIVIAIALVGASALSGCRRAADAPAPAREDPARRAAFEAGERPWREARLADLQRADGWTTPVGLHWLDPGPHYVGRARDNGIRTAVGPEQFGMFDVRGDAVHFRPHPGSGLEIDGARARAQRLRVEGEAEGPTLIRFDGGDGIAHVIRHGGRHALQLRHAAAATRTGFTGLQYWPGGPEWVIQARWTPHSPGRSIDVGDIVGTVGPRPHAGRLEFEREGRRHALEVLGTPSGGHLVVFADRTSGHGSQSTGRFLDLAPAEGGRVVLDFNRAYNPPCAFTAFTTCALPPEANRLDLAVEAGEKAYTMPR